MMSSVSMSVGTALRSTFWNTATTFVPSRNS